MRATATPVPIRKGKRRLLESCAIAAGLIALAHGGPAMAQVVGSGTITTLPSGTTNNTGLNPSTIDINGPQSIVTWTPSGAPGAGGAIDFLPSTNSLTFVGNTPGYIVLNRFTNASGGSLTDQIALNGTVNSFVSAPGLPNQQGGNIWFYNAGGILIGSTGVFNVGSLVLTSNDVLTTGGLLGPNGEIRFRGGSGSGNPAPVTVNGTINAANPLNPGSSYVALVAPRVVQAGTVSVDGSAAYVAAEQADIRINGGLFDIDVQVGAAGGNAITHTGRTTGPAHQQSDTDQSRIYMVAIPKNDAVTMLVSGQIGYDDALSAQIDPDGAVRLSAGYNITNGELNAAPVNATAANITVNDTLFRSNVIAHASCAFVGQPVQLAPTGVPGPVLPPPQQGRLFVEGDGSFIGDASATLTINAGRIGGATGNLTVQSGETNGIPGNATINVNGGLLGVGGNLTVDAQGAINASSGFSQGGVARLLVTNGGLAGAVGNVTVTANGVGSFDDGGNGGNGVGGTATISVSGAGSSLTGALVRASATGLGGGVLLDPATGATVADIGGDGIGGNAAISVQNGGSLTATTRVEADASGEGRTGLVQSGNGQGGTARVEVTGSGTSLQTPQTLIGAGGTGGGSFTASSFGVFLSQNAGNGRGGSATLSVDADGTATVNAGSVALIASGLGGNGGGENSVGGDGQGGTASVTGAGGATVQINDLGVFAGGSGGGAVSPSNETALSGDGIGGNINVTATGGTTLAIGADMALTAAGAAPMSDNIGSASGGNVVVSATSNSSINVNGQFAIDAFAGIPGNPPFARSTGSSTGGNVDLTADGGGTIRAASYLVNAGASAVNTLGTGGAARGGTIDVGASNNGQILATGSGGQFFDTSAVAGVSASGRSATGGTIQLVASGGVIDMGGGVALAAGGISGGAINPGPNNPEGRGGTILIQLVVNAANSSAIGLGSFDASTEGRTAVDGESPFNTAGNGQGGTVSFDIQGGALTASGINVSASGIGGATGDSVGTGGNATFTQTGGTATVGDMVIGADGSGQAARGQASSGTGGTATINLLGGTIDAAEIVARANGVGGNGRFGTDESILSAGRGGAGQGGNATITVDGAVVNASSLLASAGGAGGIGGDFINMSSFSPPGTPGNGGAGTGGNAMVEVVSGTVTANNLTADASGIGGTGGNSFFSSSTGGATGVGVGGSGGTGQGGTATVALQTAIGAVGNPRSIARGIGGNGGRHNVGGAGGDGFGGFAQATVTDFDAGALAISLDSSGLGGNGGNGVDGAGGNGGGGTGGTSRLAAEGPGASLTTAGSNFITGGTGGNGGNGALGFGAFELAAPSGGHGGNGRGGTIEVAANEGATVTLDIEPSDGVRLGSTGRGGNGGIGSDSAFDAEAQSGDGGFGGAGNGGTVRLVANGGTITSNGESVAIEANGIVGTGGAGGIGQGGGGNGAAGGSFGSAGGRVVIASLNGSTGPGQIALGNTDIAANGELAGRIELRAQGNISLGSLDAEALGFAESTNNNIDEAPAGIFLALDGGTISSQGDVSLTTGSSVGAYARSTGLFDVGGLLTIDAGDQIDIRHEAREGTAPTIRASDGLIATAQTGISGAPGSLLDGGDTLSLTSTTGAIRVDRLDGVNIVIDAAGAASVEHAEAANDFTATAASFRTGLNSIITGGDIVVTSPGTVDLGNSSAGGFVSIEGQSIAFNSIGAGTTVSLRAQGFGASDGIDGGTLTAGGGVTLNGRSVSVDAVQTDGTLSVSANNGAAALASANAGGDITVFANGNLTGSFASGGNIRLRATADITAAASATGGYIEPASGLVSEGFVFADADGNLNLTGGSAATMFGARAGGSVAMQGVTAGEDVFVLAGTTANLSGVSAGDDLRVQANGGITVQASQTTGTGPDGRSIVYQACCSNPAPFLQIQTSTADLSNVTLLAPTSTITATNVAAFDNFTATAGGAVTTGGLIRSGLATNITGSSLDLVAVTAGTDIALTANIGGVSSTGALAAGRDVSVNAAGAVNISELDAGDDVRVTTAAALTLGGAYSYGTGVDNEGDGSNIVLAGGVTNVTHAEADNDFIVEAASFTTGLNSIITGGDINVTSPGAVDLGNSSAGGFVQVTGQSIDFNTISAGTTVGLNATGTAAGAEGIRGGSITAGSDVNLFGNSVTATGTIQSGGSFFALANGGNAAIALTDIDGNIAITADGDLTGTYAAGGNITLTAGGNIVAAANAAGGYVGPNGVSEGYMFADANGNATLTNSSAATMFGVRAGQAASLGNATAGEDVLVLAGTTATLANVTAGDDLTATAPGGITANGLLTTGAGPDNRTIFYGPSPAGVGMLQITTAAADDSNIVLTASAGNIGGGNMNAFDNLTATASGTITTTGLLRSGLATSMSGSALSFDAITAGTDADLTATTGGIASTGALAAGRDLTIDAAGNVNAFELGAGDDIRIDAGGSLTVGAAYSLGTAVDNEGDGSNIVIAAGATSVEHAEADNDFVVNAASFRTGLNSIITGGDINVTSPGAVDLGNSSAGGFVQVTGQSIDFNNIAAGTTVGLNATGTAAGAEGIRGGSITAGSGVNLFGNSIAVTGTIQSGASLFASASGGNAAIALADIDGDIAIIANGDLTGTYAAGGNITLTARGNIVAEADAAGGYVGPNAVSEGYVFADANGNATLTNSSAATMFGVRTGQAASLSNTTAGEDVLVLAGTTATLANVTAGDDLTATAPGGITANGLLTTGAGPDNRTIFYGPSPAGVGVLQITTAAADESNIVLTASAGNIGGGNMNAFDNLTLLAAGAITTSGILRSGQATSIDGGSIVFDAINAGTTVDASATGTVPGAEGIRGANITAGGDINLDGNSIALTDAVVGGGSFFATSTGGSVAVNNADVDGNIIVAAAGNLTGTYAADGAVRLSSTANIDASATARGTAAEGNLFVDASGNVVMANSAAARMFGVNAGGSATLTNAAAGEDMLVRTGTTASLTNATAGDDLAIRAGGNVTANNVRATGTGADTHLLDYLPASGFTIMQGEGTSAINGADIVMASAAGSIDATTLSAGDDILLGAANNIAVNGATTLGLGATGGDSSIRTQGGATTLAGLDAFSDIAIQAAGLANLTGTVAAGRNATIDAQGVTLVTLADPGGFAPKTLSADGNIVVNSSAGITGGAISAGGDLTLTAGAAIAVTEITGDTIALTGATGITANRVVSNGFDFDDIVSLNSSDGDIRIGDLSALALVDASANAIHIESVAPLRIATLTTDVGDAYVHAGSGFTLANGNIAGTADFESGAESMEIASLTAANAVIVNTSGDIALDTATVAGNLDASAQGSIRITGVVTAPSIALASADIDIAATGRVGTAGTTQGLSLVNNDSASQTFVGGTGTANGYHIDAAELSRLYGTDIEIFAPQVQVLSLLSVGSAAPPDVIVDSFTMTGGAPNSNLGANGALTIRTPGKMRVTGNVQLTGLTDANALNLFADQALEVILGQGTVRLVNGAAPAGQLNMRSEDIIVATAAAIGDVGAATTTDAIETRLAQNDGIVLGEGALFARGIRAEVAGGFYVQNSGSGTRYGERRGLSFGAGGLDIRTAGPSRIVVNGVQIGPNGQITGLDTIPLLTIGGAAPVPGSYDPRSTFNGCIIANTGACLFLTLENNFPVQDVIEEEADTEMEERMGNVPPTPLITMRDLDPLSGEPLLDDPVTGAGNDDLWTPPSE
jgi:hypothetical protein